MNEHGSEYRAATASLRSNFSRSAVHSRETGLQNLQALSQLLNRHEAELAAALYADLGKSYVEAYLTEISLIKEEIKVCRRKLHSWLAPRRLPLSLAQFPGRMELIREPYGLCLIISPWNYPLQLAFAPLLACLAAGNVAVLKLAKESVNLHKLLSRLLPQYLPKQVYLVPQTLSREDLWAEKYDYIFFTGSAAAGKEIMKEAARTLTPVSLELGGKSPAIVSAHADIATAAKNIAFGKILNSGQTCVAPDYVMVAAELAPALQEALRREFDKINGDRDYFLNKQPRIVNLKRLQHLTSLLEGQNIISGGAVDKDSLHMELTLVAEPSWSSPLMQEEIFGPILPILTYNNLQELITLQQNLPKPLALYFFSDDKAEISLIKNSLSAGGICINDTIMHMVSAHAPFGGVGESGMGAYHGRYGIETFTHAKAVLHKYRFFNFKWRYPPFRDAYLKFLKFLLD